MNLNNKQRYLLEKLINSFCDVQKAEWREYIFGPLKQIFLIKEEDFFPSIIINRRDNHITSNQINQLIDELGIIFDIKDRAIRDFIRKENIFQNSHFVCLRFLSRILYKARGVCYGKKKQSYMPMTASVFADRIIALSLLEKLKQFL